MERDNEVKGNGNSYTSYWRQYDPRLGRWMSDEPKPVAWESGYAAFRNNPVYYADPSGDWPKIGQFLRKVFKKVFGGGDGKNLAGKGRISNAELANVDKAGSVIGGNFDSFTVNGGAAAATVGSSASIGGLGMIMKGIMNDPIVRGAMAVGKFFPGVDRGGWSFVTKGDGRVLRKGEGEDGKSSGQIDITIILDIFGTKTIAGTSSMATTGLKGFQVLGPFSINIDKLFKKYHSSHIIKASSNASTQVHNGDRNAKVKAVENSSDKQYIYTQEWDSSYITPDGSTHHLQSIIPKFKEYSPSVFPSDAPGDTIFFPK